MGPFEYAAIKHEEVTEQGYYKTANKSYAIVAKVIAFLKENNEVLVLKKFLNHASPGVQSWAVTYLLPVNEKKTTQVLEQIARGMGISSLAAETTLSEWRKGNLKL